MTNKFRSYMNAAYPALWINTVEPQRAQKVLAEIAFEVKKVHAQRWDPSGTMESLDPGESTVTKVQSPVAAIAAAKEATRGTVTFLWNFHRQLASIEVIQAIQNAVAELKAASRCIVVLAPSSEKLPEELARVFTTMDFALPDKDELRDIMAEVVDNTKGRVSMPEIGMELDAALGLTKDEAEDAFALSLVETSPTPFFDPVIIGREKAGALLRQAQLEMSFFKDKFKDLGGLDNLKEYTLRTSQSALSLGVLILGVPGTGKSTFAKALGNELGIPTLSLDFGRMMGSKVGESEGNMRAALAAVDAMGRVILFIDEIEKGLAGTQSSGNTDAGTKSGVGATFLKWLSDRKPGMAYIVATCNKINDLPPEYQRAGRWDSIWFVDLPNDEEKSVIWDIHQATFNVSGDRPDDTDWTGAEIRSCCRTATMMECSLKEASKYIIPVSKSMAEDITTLQKWAEGRAVMASKPEVVEVSIGGRNLNLDNN